MHIVSDFWLAILVSAVLVFLVSSVLHMLLPLHKGDMSKLPQESETMAALRNAGIRPGAYGFPFPSSMKEMGSPEMIARYNQGPVGLLTVLPNGPPAMGKSLVQWFLYSILIGVFVAYVALLGLPSGAEAMPVFRLTSTVAILAYCIGHPHESIWMGRSWTTTLKFVFDGVIYGLLTAGVFTFLWPAAA